MAQGDPPFNPISNALAPTPVPGTVSQTPDNPMDFIKQALGDDYGDTTASSQPNDNGLVELSADQVNELKNQEPEPGRANLGKQNYYDGFFNGINAGFKQLGSGLTELYANAQPYLGMGMANPDKVLESIDYFAGNEYGAVGQRKEELQQKADEIRASAPQGDGFAYQLGTFIPQAIGIVAATASAPFTAGTSLSAIPAVLSGATMATLVGSSMGEAMNTYDDYMKQSGSEGNEAALWGVGLAAGGAEYFAERLGSFNRYLPKGAIAKATTKIFAKGGDEFAEGMFKQLAKSDEFTKLVGKYGWNAIKHAGEEGFEEVATELGNIAIEYAYKGMDDGPGFDEMKDRVIGAFEGGALMGGMLSPVSTWSKNAMVQKARQQRGYVAIAKGPTGSVYEVIDQRDNGDYDVIDAKGNQLTMPEETIDQIHRFGVNDFNKMLTLAKQGKEVTAQMQAEAELSVERDRIKATVQQRRYAGADQFEFIVNGQKQTGAPAIVTAQMADGSKYQILAGSVNEPNPGQPMIGINLETGERAMLSHKDVSNIDVVASEQMETDLMQEAQMRMNNELNAQLGIEKAAEFNPGDAVTFNGLQGEIINAADPTQGVQIKVTDQAGEEQYINVTPEQIGQIQPSNLSNNSNSSDSNSPEIPDSSPATPEQINSAQPQKTMTVGKKQLAYEQQEDGSFYIPFADGKDETKAVLAEVDETQFDVVPVTEEVPIVDAPAFAKKKSNTITKGVKIVPKTVNKPTNEQDLQGQQETPNVEGLSNVQTDETIGEGTQAAEDRREEPAQYTEAQGEPITQPDNKEYQTLYGYWKNKLKGNGIDIDNPSELEQSTGLYKEWLQRKSEITQQPTPQTEASQTPASQDTEKSDNTVAGAISPKQEKNPYEGMSESELEKAREKIVAGKKKATKKPSKEIQAVAQMTYSEPYQIVLQYFATGGKINPSALFELYGKAGKEDDPDVKRKVESERRPRFTWVSKHDGLSIKTIADKLWEQNTHLRFDAMEYRDAVEEVINSFTSPQQMAKKLLNIAGDETTTIDEHAKLEQDYYAAQMEDQDNDTPEYDEQLDNELDQEENIEYAMNLEALVDDGRILDLLSGDKNAINENGEIDWNVVSLKLANDPGYYTGDFLFDFNEQELNRIKELANENTANQRAEAESGEVNSEPDSSGETSITPASEQGLSEEAQGQPEEVTPSEPELSETEKIVNGLQSFNVPISLISPTEGHTKENTIGKHQPRDLSEPIRVTVGNKDQLVIEDGNHRYFTFLENGETSVKVIFGTQTNKAEKLKIQRVLPSLLSQVKPELTASQKAVSSEIDGKVNDLKAQLAELKANRSKKLAELQNRNSLFGDTQDTGNTLFETDDTFDTSKEAINKAIQPFTNQIADLERQIEQLSTSKTNAVKQAGNQTEITEQPRPQFAGQLLDKIITNDVIAQEEAKVDTNPSEAQIEAGNYKKGHITVNGFDISIENPKGSTRSGTDANGKAWSIEMQNSYGYFKGTKGYDGDQIDVFLGDNPLSDKVFVVDQVNQDTGEFDESKTMLLFDNAEQAKAAYLSNYSKDWKGFKAITETTVEDFKTWLYDGAKQRKPYNEYKDTPEAAILTGEQPQSTEPVSTAQSESPVNDIKNGTKDEILSKLDPNKTYSFQTAKSGRGLSETVESFKNSPQYNEDLISIASKIGSDAKAIWSKYDGWYNEDGYTLDTETQEGQSESSVNLPKTDENPNEIKGEGVVNLPKSEPPYLPESTKEDWINYINNTKDRSQISYADFIRAVDGNYLPEDNDSDDNRVITYTLNGEVIAKYDVVEEPNSRPLREAFNKWQQEQPLLDKEKQALVDDILSFFNENPGDFLPTNSSIITKHINGDGTNLKAVWKVIEGIKGVSLEPQGQEYVFKHKPTTQPQFAGEKLEQVIAEDNYTDEPKLTEPLSEKDNTEQDNSEMSAEEEAEGLELAGKINDFGQKIGLARKDTAERGFTFKSKGETKQPAWKAKYKVFSNAGSVEINRYGKKTENDPTKFSLAIVNGNFFKTLKRDIDTKEEAEAMIPMYEVALNHRVYKSNKNQDEFSIYRRWSSGKLWEVKTGFKTQEEALLYMAQNAEDIISYKTPRIERPHLDNIERLGLPDRRKGNITPEKFMQTFGFRGGEFGNWVAGDERQEMLNLSYDALLDMAEVLNVKPSALSLGGRLAIGFGSRGKGLSGAAAHFEPERGVINLTKIHGAGALAHEWFHAFDSYMGFKGRKSMLPDENGVIQAKINSDRDYLSGAYSSNPNVRKEVKSAWKATWDTMRYKTKQSEYDINKGQSRLDSAVKSLTDALNYAKAWIKQDRTFGLRKKAATPEQLARWDALMERVNTFDFGEISGKKTKKKYSFEQEYELQRQFNDLHKEITGRELTRIEYNDFKRIELANQEISKAESGETFNTKVPTTFFRDSKEIDKTRSTDYWSTNLEMAARAFEAYIDDAIKQAGGQNDYLVHSVNNAIYQMLYDAKPYPEGQERQDIGNAIKDFFAVLQTETDESGNDILFRQSEVQDKTYTIKEAKRIADTINKDNVNQVIYKLAGVLQRGRANPIHGNYNAEKGSFEYNYDPSTLEELRLNTTRLIASLKRVLETPGITDAAKEMVNDEIQRYTDNIAEMNRILEGGEITEGNATRFRKEDNILDYYIQKADTQKEYADKARELGKKYNVPIRVVTNRNQLPMHIYTRMRNNRVYPGVFDTRTGDVFVLVNEVQDLNEVELTITHEIVAHKGLRELVGNEAFDQLCDDVYYSMHNADINNIAELYNTNDRKVIADEYMASLAETGKFPNWFDRVIASVRNMLREAGMKARYSDADIMYLLWESRRRLTKQGAAGYIDYKASESDVVANVNYSANLADNNARFMILGERGAANLDLTDKQKRLKNLEVAKKMEAKKKDAKTIRLATGWEKGTDKKWKYEIQDIELTKGIIVFDKVNIQFPLKDAIKGSYKNNLFKAYPQLLDVNIVFRDTKEYAASWNVNARAINVSTYYGDINQEKDAEMLKSVIIHEIQHAIQDIEGFAKGGNDETLTIPTDEVIEDIFNMLDMDAVSEIMRKHDIGGDYAGEMPIEWLTGIRDQVKNDPESWITINNIIVKNSNRAWSKWNLSYGANGYKRLTGEVEARNVQTRIRLTDQQRRETLLSETEDIDHGNQIIRFRISPDNKPRMLTEKGDKFREFVQDKMLSVRKLQEMITKRSGTVPQAAQVYEAENRASSRSKAQIEDYNNNEQSNLIDTLVKIDKPISEINLYLKAKSSLERNDNEGTMAISEDKDDEWNREYVTKLITDFETSISPELTQELWDNIKACTDFAIKSLYLGNVISKDAYNGMKKRKFYVPLKNWQTLNSENPEDYYDYITGADRTAYQGLKKAHGRSSEADDPLAYIEAAAHSAVATANKNMVKHKALMLVRLNHQMTDLFNLNRVYLMDIGEKDEDGNPVLYNVIKGENGSAMRIARFDAQGNPVLVSQGNFEQLYNDRIIFKKTTREHSSRRPSYLTRQHEVKVYENGDLYVIAFGDPRIANALNNYEMPWLETATRIAQNTIGVFNRWLTSNFTAKNPAFIPVNWIKDTGYAELSHSIKDDGEVKAFTENYPKSVQAIHRYLSGKADIVNNEFDKLYQAFREFGGETGYVHLVDIKSLKKDIEREVNRRKGIKKGWDQVGQRKAIKKAGELLNYMALMSENSSRFATFVAAVKAGRSYEQAATEAKNVTVNFNRKGRLSGLFGAFYGFFNATVQGGHNFAYMAKHHGKNMAIATGTFYLAAVMLAELMRSVGPEDEEGNKEYDKLPLWVRQTCLTIPDFSGNFITIPLPPGFRSIWAMGITTSDLVHGKSTPGEATFDMISSITEMFSPFAVNDVELSQGKIPYRTIVPTTLVPIYDAATNQDFTGKKLFYVPYTKDLERYTPKTQWAPQNVNGAFKTAAELINKAGGGNENRPAGFNKQGEYNGLRDIFFNLNPAVMEHTAEYYLGGRGKFFNELYKTVRDAADPKKEVQSYNIPVIKRLYTKPYAGNVWEDYREIGQQVKDFDYFLKNAQKTGDIDQITTMIDRQEMLVISAMYKQYSKAVQAYSDAIPYMNNPAEAKEMRKNRELLIKDFMQRVSEVKDTDNKKDEEPTIITTTK